jgi:hypothetical protein
VTFDQGSADGKRPPVRRQQRGSIYFLDYSASKLVNSALNFADSIGGVGEADGVAPLVGAGSTSTGVPEFPMGALVLVRIAIPMMLVLRQRAIKALHSSLGKSTFSAKGPERRPRTSRAAARR